MSYNQGLSTLLFVIVVLMKFGQDSATDVCSFVLEGRTGTFTSPNYPSPPQLAANSSSSSAATRRGRCQWEIRVPEGMGIQLKFGEFNMDGERDDCDDGELQVFSGLSKHRNSIDTYCSGNHPDAIQMLNNTATVVFRWPTTSFSGSGFLISYIATAQGESIDDFVTCTKTGKVGIDVTSFSAVCPSGCRRYEEQKVWGGPSYRDDSHLCQAAVHAGLISDSFGGRVQVVKGVGETLYRGSLANGVYSNTGAMSDYSFAFPDSKVCDATISIAASQFTASSVWVTKDGTKWDASKALLEEPGIAWSPDDPSFEQWLQVDFKKVINVTGVQTRGSTKPYRWSKEYKVKYSFDGVRWANYHEEGSEVPMVFAGNRNFFSPVRNNFIRPTIVARFLRIYPTPVETALRYGIKLGVFGCDVIGDVSLPSTIASPMTSPAPPPTTPPEPAPAPTQENTTYEARTIMQHSTSNISAILSLVNHVTSSTTVRSPTPVNPPSSDIYEIPIIAIVTALAVTSILLSALVLLLVKKRKKEPKTETIIPTSQANATYTAGVGLHYIPPNKSSSKKHRTVGGDDRDNVEFKNENYRETHPLTGGVEQPMTLQNSRGGVTLLYNEHEATRNNGMVIQHRHHTSFDQSGGQQTLLRTTCDSDSFATEEEDHEYQVIPEYDDLQTQTARSSHTSHRCSSKASTGSSLGKHSGNRMSPDTMLPPAWQPPAPPIALPTWAGVETWSNVDSAPFSPMRPHDHGVTSFTTPPANIQPPPTSSGNGLVRSKRAGTFPHHTCVSTNHTSSTFNSFTAPRSNAHKAVRSSSAQQHRRLRGQSPPATTQLPPPQRYSSSSAGSNRIEGAVRETPDPDSPYYSSVPTCYDADPPASSYENSQRARMPSYKFPNSQPAHFPDVRNEAFNGQPEVITTYPVATSQQNQYSVQPVFAEKAGLRRGESAKQRSGYDHLHRDQFLTTTSDSSGFATPPSPTYNQLDLNTPI